MEFRTYALDLGDSGVAAGLLSPGVRVAGIGIVGSRHDCGCRKEALKSIWWVLSDVSVGKSESRRGLEWFAVGE